MRLFFEGSALAILVVFVFLRDWRATFVSAVALPLSVIPAFALMHAMGFTLNTVTLLSLSLVVGVLVDDAIVEVENIERHMLMGKTPLQAATDAAAEIGLAVVATTFTLIAVFLPTAFMSGMAGKFFIQFGWTAAGAVFCSLVVARLLTPMMAAYRRFLRPRQVHSRAKTPPKTLQPRGAWTLPAPPLPIGPASIAAARILQTHLGSTAPRACRGSNSRRLSKRRCSPVTGSRNSSDRASSCSGRE